MLLLLDECTTRTVEQVFRERNHEVRFIVEDLAPETYDPVIAKYADVIGAAVVTWNHKHFRLLFNHRRSSGEWTYPNMSLIGFQCLEVDGATRLRSFISLIEREHELVQTLPSKRFHVLVGKDHFRVFR